jgi:hypothetical protein
MIIIAKVQKKAVNHNWGFCVINLRDIFLDHLQVPHISKITRKRYLGRCGLHTHIFWIYIYIYIYVRFLFGKWRTIIFFGGG